MSAWQRLAAVSLAFALSSACKGRERADLRRVTPLVPGARAPVAEAPDAGRPRASNAQRTHRAVRYIADRPAPDGALGLRWGVTRADVAARNAAVAITCRDSGEYTFCPRALVEASVAGVVTYEFCASGLCAVSIDAAATRDEAAVTGQFERLAAMVRQSLGEPSDEARSVGPGCAGHLALCLASKQAELAARWTWRDGPQVQVSIDQDEEDAFQALAAVTWFSAERARRQEPAEPSAAPAGDAGERTDAR